MIHLAIIPDGNRRWAKERGLDPWKGHEKALEGFRIILDWIKKRDDIGVLTLWCFSTENWSRNEKEVSALMRLFEQYLREEKGRLVKNDIRFVHSGRKDRFPKSLASVIAELEDATKDCKKYTLHIALDYGGRDELVRAVKKIQGSDITEETLRAHLDHPELPDIDLAIRTGGEMRFSNFSLWQTAYAEWMFLDKYFPDITTEDLDDCVTRFLKRQRRYGA